MPLYLKLVLLGITYHADYITHVKTLSVLIFKSSLINHNYVYTM